MKFNTLRHLVFPWFVLFCAIIGMIIADGAYLHLSPTYQDSYWIALGLSVFLCMSANFATLTKAGIWLAHSLPSNLRHRPWFWLLRAGIAVVFAYSFFLMGKLSFIPLIWQGAVIPVVFTVCVFILVWNLMGPLLAYCSHVSFSRFSAFILSWPIFVIIPITALFVGNTVINAYRESRPDFSYQGRAIENPPSKTENATSEPANEDAKIPATDTTALEMQTAAQSGESCNDLSKLVQNSMSPQSKTDVAYWAIQSLKCCDIKSVVAMPKLVDLMLKHPNTQVRAAAIRGMLKYSTSDIKRIGYLLIKRVSETEPLEVIEAASIVLVRLGEDEAAWVNRRLTSLLEVPRTSALASKLLVSKLKREDLVSTFVSENLDKTGSEKARAISMICALPEKSRKIAEPYLDSIVASIDTGSETDNAVKALECMGSPGLESLRKELAHPQKLQKSVAARALAEGTWSEEATVLKAAENCVHDSTGEVRQWCSQALGKVGASAVPGILELLKSDDTELKEAGTQALHLFKDPEARNELLKVRAKNSGWMANQRNLEIARAIDRALENMAQE